MLTKAQQLQNLTLKNQRIQAELIASEKIATEKRKQDFAKKFQGNTSLKPKQVYTGTEIIGIAQLHKSNAQPIFNKQAAIDVSQMRR